MCKERIGSWLLAICFWLLASVQLSAQEVDAFIRISMSPTKVVEKQPIKVKITAYSSTWFAEPLDFQNVQVPNAFIMPFARTQSGIHYVEGKKYAGLEFFFLVFPYKAGDYTFPALEIKTSIPPEGDWKGKPTTLRTRPRKFVVSELQGGKDMPDMVAKNVYLSDRWTKDLNRVKVGDVITRSVYIRAKGTLPSFIADIHMEELDFASIYEKQPTLKDERDDNDANGLRIEKYAYLFEKEGEFEIPSVSISWWNPYVKRKYEKKIPARKITVLPNPDLGLVASIKDSLDLLSGNNLGADEAKTWRDYVPIVIDYAQKVIPVLVGVWLLTWLVVRLIRIRKSYLGSEKYYFHQLTRRKDLQSLYQWYDQYRQGKALSPSLHEILPEIMVTQPNWSAIISTIKQWRKNKPESTQSKIYQLNP
ncbi:MAG: BatD family protein [Reichenbachiella sp.]